MSDKYTITLDRSEALRLVQACNHLYRDFRAEATDAATSEERKKICNSSAAMWKRIADAVDAQVDVQDAANGIK